MKRTNLHIPAILLVILLAVLFAAPAALADGAGITTWDELQTALSAGGTVTLTQDITAPGEGVGLYVPTGVAVTLDLGGYTLSMPTDLDDPYEPEELYALGVITVRGSLILEGSGTITSAGWSGVYVEHGSFTMNGGTIADCYFPGVYNEGGSFVMNDGSISKNGKDMEYALREGVRVFSDGSFTMNGGTISGSGENGVYCTDGTFTMNGGTISGNGGYGVFNHYNGSFTMNGGTISDNEYNGVFNSDGTFTLRGGSILDGIRLRSNNVIIIDSTLPEGVCYSVDMDTPGVFTSGLSGHGSVSNFSISNENYSVVLNNSGEAEAHEGEIEETLSEIEETLSETEETPNEAEEMPSEAEEMPSETASAFGSIGGIVVAVVVVVLVGAGIFFGVVRRKKTKV